MKFEKEKEIFRYAQDDEDKEKEIFHFAQDDKKEQKESRLGKTQQQKRTKS